MLVKIGGEQTTFLKGAGIHYHMLIASKVEYVATDDRRQEIAWVRVSRGDGSVTEYNNEDNPVSEEERGNYEMRTMDCMDCHNRPSHQFPAPMLSVNEALMEGTISRELPSIKVQAVRAIDTPYDSTNEAVVGIANALRAFYRNEYPEVFEKKNADVVRTIKKVQDIYRNTVFPEMKAKWSAYPDNIGHRDSPGCFRCHNDVMKSATEKACPSTIQRTERTSRSTPSAPAATQEEQTSTSEVCSSKFRPLDGLTNQGGCPWTF
jgi:hypothetical protein